MAHLSESFDAGLAHPGPGPFNRLARVQYTALVAMRLRIFANNFRTNEGAFEFGARAASYFIYSLMGIGLGVGAGAVAYSLVSHRHLQALAIEFWAICVFWQAISIALASFQEQFDLGGLLRFPVNFGSFFLLHLLFGIVDASTLAGGFSCLGLLTGIVIARPALFGATSLALLEFAAFNIFLVRAILAWLDRWLAKRRSREIVGAVFLLVVLSVQLLNPVLRDEPGLKPRRHAGGHATAEMLTWLKAVRVTQAWLPPGLAAAAVKNADEQDQTAAVVSVGVLGIPVLAAGALLGLRLRAEYRGENLGESPGSVKNRKREVTWRLSGSGPVSAEIEKELRTLLRSMPQIYAVFVPMVMVVIIGSLFRNGASAMNHPFRQAIPVCVAYGVLGFTQLIYNNLGSEAQGIQMIFLFPIPVRTVVLAKNLFHAALYIFVALVSGLLASLRIGRPGVDVIAATLSWIAFALPANLAAGNVISLTMAYRVNLGRIGRQSGSQANALLSMLIQTTILGIGIGVISLCTIFDRLWLATPILLALSVIAAFTWLTVLRNVDAMANARRDTLIAKLVKTA
jgi:ABC-2 type transport system permease protein